MNRDTCSCPLCQLEAEPTVLYRHLQTSHRKSELSRQLLNAQRADEAAERQRVVPRGSGD